MSPELWGEGGGYWKKKKKKKKKKGKHTKLWAKMLALERLREGKRCQLKKPEE